MINLCEPKEGLLHLKEAETICSKCVIKYARYPKSPKKILSDGSTVILQISGLPI